MANWKVICSDIIERITEKSGWLKICIFHMWWNMNFAVWPRNEVSIEAYENQFYLQIGVSSIY